MGHRGAAGLAPENTLPSFRKAVELGVRVLELDVRLTRDGVPVVFHDDRLDRVTAGRGLLAEHDWAGIAVLPVLPESFRGAYPEARIPELASLLPALPADCRYLVELKPDPERGRELVDRTLAVLRAAGNLTRCRFISFDWDLLTRVRELEADAALGLLTGKPVWDALFSRAAELRAETVQPQHGLVDEAFLRRARDGGLRVNAWTVNRPEEVRRLAQMGMDEITTDYPDVALAVLAR